jgi:hypothetical protein
MSTCANIFYSGTGSSAMSYSPSSHTMPALFQHRDSFVHQRELESAFCSDLICCGTRVRDLHELLHHYEEHHHAPIEEEPEPKEDEIDIENHDGDQDMMMEDVDSPFPTHLPTQPHELAALTSSPLLRQKQLINLNTAAANPIDNAVSTPLHVSPTISTSSIHHQQHTEDILRQALPSLVTHSNAAVPGPEGIHYFRADALYQTCGKCVDLSITGGANGCYIDDGQDKPYKCPVENCDKAYKNPNGLKYHQMHGHSDEDTLSEAERDAQKPYMCTIGYCNKRYKNLNGLKYHIEHSHIAKLKQLPAGLDNNITTSPHPYHTSLPPQLPK